MKIYLSGKISGLPEKEYTENFENAKNDVYDYYTKNKTLVEIINPLNIKPLFGNCKRTKEYIEDGVKKYKKHWTEFYKCNWINYMATDLWQLKKCDAIAVQKNWVNSKGAFIEVFFSKFIFKQVIILL